MARCSQEDDGGTSQRMEVLLNRYGRATVGVVGLGPTGASFTWHVLQEFTAHPCSRLLRITMIEPSAKLGMGYAFRSRHRLNMRADTISIDPDRPAHFAQWLRRNSNSSCQDQPDYPPRSQFGKYVAQMLSDAIAAASASDLDIEHWRASAIDIERVGKSFRVTGNDGDTRDFEILVLALGESHYGALSSYRGASRFIASPWLTAQFEDIPSSARIAIAGTSLSAVDACLQLLGQGHQGLITCLSRTRGFPKVQGAPEYYQPRVMTKSWLRETTASGRTQIGLHTVAAALRKELDHTMGTPYEPGATDPREWFSVKGLRVRRKRPANEIFNDAVLSAETSHTRWYYTLDSLSPIIPHIWNYIDARDQAHFLRRYRASWNEYRHSMPMANALALLPAAVAGQLIIQPGLRSVAPSTSQDAAKWNVVTSSGDHEGSYDFLIDATGGQSAIACQRDPLLQACRRRGLVKVDPRGGVRVVFDNCQVIDARGEACENLYFLGPLTFGTHFYTNSFETNRNNAYHAARDIERILQGKRPRPSCQPAGHQISL